MSGHVAAPWVGKRGLYNFLLLAPLRAVGVQGLGEGQASLRDLRRGMSDSSWG